MAPYASQGWAEETGLAKDPRTPLFLLHLTSQPAVGPADPCHPFLCPRINQQQGSSLLQSRVPADRMLWSPHPPLQPSCFGVQADSPQGLCTALPLQAVHFPRWSQGPSTVLSTSCSNATSSQGSFLTILSKSAQPLPSLWPALVSFLVLFATYIVLRAH